VHDRARRGEALVTAAERTRRDRPRRGLSLHIGVNKIDRSHYAADVPDLEGCVPDALYMARLASDRGFTVLPPLLDEHAKSDAVLDALELLAGADAPGGPLEAGDILLLTFAGHGGQVPNDDGTRLPSESSAWGTDAERDETWCLYDRQLIDDELFACWARFAPGVRILVVSDSCHSGSIGSRFAAEMPPVRALTDEEAQTVYAAHAALYQRLKGRYPNGRDVEVGASIVVLAACQDWEKTRDGLPNGAFTAALKRAYEATPAHPTYLHLHQAIHEQLARTQRPAYVKLGAPDVAFDLGAPFAI
jgi:hypothetical protein